MNITSFSNQLAPITQLAIRESVEPSSVKELILHILSNPSFSTLALCGILSLSRSSIGKGFTCTLSSYFTQAVAQNQIKMNWDDPIQKDSQTILFDSHDIKEWHNTDGIEPDEIEGTLIHNQQLLHVKQSVLRTGIIGKSLIKTMNDITQSYRNERLFQELTYFQFKDRETQRLFIGRNDCHFKPFSQLNEFEKSADIILHRLLAFAIPGVHDGNMGINEQTQQSVLLDIEGTDFSLDGLAKFLRKCRIMKSTPAESSKINNQLFKDIAFIFETLKEHLKFNEDYRLHITQSLNKINVKKLNKSALIDTLKKDSREEGNFIDAEASVNLFFDQLKSISLSELFLNAQLNRIDTLISIFTNIGEMTKWNALQRGMVVLYPKLLEEQAQLLSQTNIKPQQHNQYEAYNPQHLLEVRDYFTTNREPNMFTGTLSDAIQQSLPNGYLSPLRVLMLVLKQVDKTAQA
jgi:hypothetical protein